MNMAKLSDLPNIGPEVEKQLNQVGIESIQQLSEIGSEQAWLKIKAIDDSACIHRLYALEGAIHNINKKELPLERKAELKEFYQQMKG
jgi:TfoX C-terminal domain.